VARLRPRETLIARADCERLRALLVAAESAIVADDPAFLRALECYQALPYEARATAYGVKVYRTRTSWLLGEPVPATLARIARWLREQEVDTHA